MLRQCVVLLISVGMGCGGSIDGAVLSDDDPSMEPGDQGGNGGGDEGGGGNEVGAAGKPMLAEAGSINEPRTNQDGGTSSDVKAGADALPRDTKTAGDDEPPAGWVPTIVGVGYAGIRAMSKDLGRSWPIHPALEGGPGNDDGDLLRGVAYGKGVWLTGGWQHFISTDAVNWTKAPLPQGCGLMEGVAYGLGKFVMTCGDGNTYLSNDGRTWRNGKQGVGTGRHISVVYGVVDGVGKFAVSGDTGASFTSTDGITWTNLPGIRQARYCAGTFKDASNCAGFTGHGIWLRTTMALNIERSLDGRTWAKSAGFPSFVGWYAFGYAPP